jgi:hypothetical protein
VTPPVLRQAPARRALRLRDLVVRRLRRWFHERDYIEVDTPQRVACPGIDAHVDALPAGDGFYLATSPELEMKISTGLRRIVQVARAFRRRARSATAPNSRLPEWYASGEDYLTMAATEDPSPRRRRARQQGVLTRLAAWLCPSCLGVDDIRALGRLVSAAPRSGSSRTSSEGRTWLVDSARSSSPVAGLAGAGRRSAANPAVCGAELVLDIEICNGFSS